MFHCPPPWSVLRTCSSTSANQLWQQPHSSSHSCLCSDMSLYSFGLEPLSCHTWNKDRTRRWNNKDTNTHTFLYSFSITYSMDSKQGGTTLAMQIHFLPPIIALMSPGEPQGIWLSIQEMDSKSTALMKWLSFSCRMSAVVIVLAVSVDHCSKRLFA